MIKPMKPREDLERFKKENLTCIVGEKLDGIRVLCHIDKNTKDVSWYSSTLKPLNNFHHLDTHVLYFTSKFPFDEDVWLDGEMTAASFEKVVSQFRRMKELDPSVFVYNVFDVPFLDGAWLIDRIDVINKFCEPNSKIKILKQERLPVDIAVHFAEHVISKGGEGAVLKKWDSLYTEGKSNDWCKIKKDDTIDVTVVDFVEGKGRNTGRLGAFVCKTEDGKTFNVGTGLTDEQREEFWQVREDLEQRPKIIEVKYFRLSQHGVPLLPRFVRVRDDKE